MNIASPIPYANEAPQPLLREIPRGNTYPIEALGALRPLVEAVHSKTQAPVAIAAQSALSVASLVVQGHANVETLAGFVPASLFCLTVAQSGERKSACDKLIMQGLRDIERARAADYAQAKAAWDTANKLWSAKCDRLIREASGTNAAKACAAEADLASLGTGPIMPLSPKVTTQEPTLEGLIKLYLTGQPSLGLFSDEGGGFLGGHAMNADNRLKTVAGLSALWGGDALDRVRAGDGASTLYGRRLALHLMVQPVAARPLLADPIASGQGFLARFLITEPPSAIGTRLGRVDDRINNDVIGAASRRLADIMAAALPVTEANSQELEPRALGLTSEAKALLHGYYEATERAQISGGELEQVRPFASKSPEQAARIAAVLTLWGNLDASHIEAETMADAIALAQFYLFEAKRLSEAAAVSQDTDRAEALRRWIVENWPDIAKTQGRDPQTIVPRDIVTMGPNAIRETAKVKKLMAVLADHGWLVALEPGTIIDGQGRKLAYRIAGRT